MRPPLPLEPAIPGSVGSALLDDLRRAITDYVVLPSPEAANAVTLWVAVSHCLSAFDFAPRLVIKSPEKRCGKSRLLEVLNVTCHRALMTSGISEAALFRSIGADPPTIILDEADTIFGTKVKAEQNEGIRGILNSGFRRGQGVWRVEGPQHTPTLYPTFAMAAIAGIGSLPDTIEDRAVVVSMRRRLPGERVLPYRMRRDEPRLSELRDRLAAWAKTIVEALTGSEPVFDLEDREADTWEPLVAVADAAGGDWPIRARVAAERLTRASAEHDSDANVNLRLLRDIQGIFENGGVDFIGSQELVSRLLQIAESPWADSGLSVNRLAVRLRAFGIKPRHDTTGNVRGYARTDFNDSFERYLPPADVSPSEPVNHPHLRALAADDPEVSDSSDRQDDGTVSDAVPHDPVTLTASDTPGATENWRRLISLPLTTEMPCGHLREAMNTDNGKCALCIIEAKRTQTTLAG